MTASSIPACAADRLVEFADGRQLARQVERLQLEHRPRVVGTGEEQQPLDQPGEVLGRVEAGRQRLAVVVPAYVDVAKATSATFRIEWTGVRSSWAMSPENRSRRPKESWSRSSMTLKVRARSPSSAGNPSAAMRSPNRSGPIRRAVAAISPRGRSPRRAITMPATAKRRQGWAQHESHVDAGIAPKAPSRESDRTRLHIVRSPTRREERESGGLRPCGS